MVRISELKAHDGETVTLQGWLYNSRGKGKIMFLLLRDGSGICQCVTLKSDVGEDLFAELKSLGQESSLKITGKVKVDERAPGGVELDLHSAEIIQNADIACIQSAFDHWPLWMEMNT
ncbi:MAG TPA: asparagine--tRNA ligase, partial [Planctomycetes bacterium]|nr:asparagine--tRNA ligase [Planctomycetota bacterium]